MKMKIKIGISLLSCLLLTSCNTFWEKDNTPPPSNLVQFTPTVKPQQLWDNRIAFESNRERLKLNPTMTTDYIVVTDSRGTITVVKKATGKIHWKLALNKVVTASAAADDKLIIVGTKHGQVIALNLSTKKPEWQASVGNEILATPVIQDNIALVKTVDGRLIALSSQDGRQRWSHYELEPNLILRNASVPQVTHNTVVVGYASGKVVKLSLETGRVLWSQNIAIPKGGFAIQRMIDIDANPIVSGNYIFAATYQGKIAALNFDNGNIVWEHEISTYTGITTDDARVYVSDAKSDLWALDRATGKVIWRLTSLEYRHITRPALQGRYLIVGDAQGALHWLNKQDGSFAGRVQLGGSGILADPLVLDRTAYILTQDGYLIAYTV